MRLPMLVNGLLDLQALPGMKCGVPAGQVRVSPRFSCGRCMPSAAPNLRPFMHRPRIVPAMIVNDCVVPREKQLPSMLCPPEALDHLIDGFMRECLAIRSGP